MPYLVELFFHLIVDDYLKIQKNSLLYYVFFMFHFIHILRLHKSLSKEQSWKEQYNNSLDQMQQLIAQRDGTVIDAQKETNKLQVRIQFLAILCDIHWGRGSSFDC